MNPKNWACGGLKSRRIAAGDKAPRAFAAMGSLLSGPIPPAPTPSTYVGPFAYYAGYPTVARTTKGLRADGTTFSSDSQGWDLAKWDLCGVMCARNNMLRAVQMNQQNNKYHVPTIRATVDGGLHWTPDIYFDDVYSGTASASGIVGACMTPNGKFAFIAWHVRPTGVGGSWNATTYGLIITRVDRYNLETGEAISGWIPNVSAGVKVNSGAGTSSNIGYSCLVASDSYLYCIMPRPWFLTPVAQPWLGQAFGSLLPVNIQAKIRFAASGFRLPVEGMGGSGAETVETFPFGPAFPDVRAVEGYANDDLIIGASDFSNAEVATWKSSGVLLIPGNKGGTTLTPIVRNMRTIVHPNGQQIRASWQQYSAGLAKVWGMTNDRGQTWTYITTTGFVANLYWPSDPETYYCTWHLAADSGFLGIQPNAGDLLRRRWSDDVAVAKHWTSAIAPDAFTVANGAPAAGKGI